VRYVVVGMKSQIWVELKILGYLCFLGGTNERYLCFLNKTFIFITPIFTTIEKVPIYQLEQRVTTNIEPVITF
jgi:hypothetical protein